VSTAIPISAIKLEQDVERLVIEVIRSGHLVQGPMVERLEAEFAELCEVPHAVAVNSGTTALVAALQALEIGPGDEVVTSPFTFVATINALLEAGATARFADIDPITYTSTPEEITKRLSERTRAVLPVHLYGHPADMTGLMSAIQSTGTAVVEDAAQAIGATTEGRPVGSFGLGCFSLYATKNVTTGEGGVITTADDRLADRLRVLRNQGMRARYEYEMPGHNYRLTDLQAALALPQMSRLSELTAMRRHHAARLTEGLSGLPGLVTPSVRDGVGHVFHQYTVRVTSHARLRRDDLSQALTSAGIGNGVYYPKPIHAYACYRDHPHVQVEPMPEAEKAAREVLSLPVHPSLSDHDIDRITEAIRRLLGG
jgi:dTDP-4-amino-4,6-dideoxygalactose transaminase